MGWMRLVALVRPWSAALFRVTRPTAPRMRPAALSGLRGATGCPPGSPARPHGVHNQTRVAPPSVPGPAHPPVSEAVSATPPKTCRAGWVTAAAMDGRGSECVQEVRPSGRDPPGAARLRTKPADTGPLSPRHMQGGLRSQRRPVPGHASNGSPDAACGLVRAMERGPVPRHASDRSPDAACGLIRATGCYGVPAPVTRTPARGPQPDSRSASFRSGTGTPARVRSGERNAAEDVPRRVGHGSGHGWPR